MDRDPTKTAAREARRLKRLGPNPACVFCGPWELAALLVVTDPALADAVRQILLAEHHVLGRAHDPELTIILCLNHHAIVTESLRRGVVPMVRQPNELERQIARHQGLATFFRDFADSEDREAETLEKTREASQRPAPELA